MCVLIICVFRSNVSNSLKIQDKPISPIVKKSHLVKPQIQQTKKEEVQTPIELPINITESTLPVGNACDLSKLLVLICLKFDSF